MAFVRITAEMAAKAVLETDWARVRATTDAEIDRQIAEDPDTAPIATDAELLAMLARGTRERLGLTQAAFARRFGIRLGTLRDWEQGRKKPDATALTYLRVISREPEMVERALKPRVADGIPRGAVAAE
jgi:putative transcriptional regulator